MFKRGPSWREMTRRDIEWIWKKVGEQAEKISDLQWRLVLRDFSDDELVDDAAFIPQSLVDAEIARRVRLKWGDE